MAGRIPITHYICKCERVYAIYTREEGDDESLFCLCGDKWFDELWHNTPFAKLAWKLLDDTEWEWVAHDNDGTEDSIPAL